MNNENRKCVYIPSIDAKDLYLANHFIDEKRNKQGYRLLTRKGTINFSKYINSFDYSLDLIKLREIANGILPKKELFSFSENGKEYSNKIINVTFKYSMKKFNKLKKNTFIKQGYDLIDTVFHDSIAIVDGEIIGIQTNTSVLSPVDNLPSGFKYISDNNSGYYIDKNPKVDKSVRELRKILYEEGFICEGIHYVRFKRSSGSARVGKCLFIDERLYQAMHKWEMCGVSIVTGDSVDLAALEAYIALPTSSIVDLIKIKPENILIVPDRESIFNESSIVTEIGEDGWLKTGEKTIQVSNSIFDGQSLIDKSLMGEYDKFGMLLLRNRYFKSCCFNTNISKFFRDNKIYEISQLHPQSITLAQTIDDIKLITTPNSIKYAKFGSLLDWLKKIDSMFGIVKHEKKTHFFDGKMVQAHYQLLNTVRLTPDEVSELVRPSLDYVSKINTIPEVLKYHVKCSLREDEDFLENYGMSEKNEIIYSMMNLSKTFYDTKLYYDFKKETCKAYLRNLKKGHLLINGNYSVLFGNPYEMLLHSIGCFDGNTSLPPGTVHTLRYDFDTELLGCRSPHISTSNILITKNIRHDAIDRYFNLTDEIVCINAINENILERLSGADYDSDSMIISNNHIIINAAKKYYKMFKVPANHVYAKKVSRIYNAENQADLDFRTSDNRIGEIVNLSQELNTIMWDTINSIAFFNKSDDEIYNAIKNIYYDICQLNIMSCIEIDKAKKEFDVNMGDEIKRIRNRYKQTDKDGKSIKPAFLGYIAKTKGYYDSEKKSYVQHATTMDYVLKEISRSRAAKGKASDFTPLSNCFYFSEYNKNLVNKKQISKIIEMCYSSSARISAIRMCNLYDIEEKSLLTNREKEALYYSINALKVNPHTLSRLINYTDMPEHSKISKLLFNAIFNYCGNSLVEILPKMDKPTTFLESSRSGNIDIYDMKYEIKKVECPDF